MMVLSISGLVKNVYPVKTISEVCIEVVSKKACTMNQVTQTHIERILKPGTTSFVQIKHITLY